MNIEEFLEKLFTAHSLAPDDEKPGTYKALISGVEMFIKSYRKMENDLAIKHSQMVTLRNQLQDERSFKMLSSPPPSQAASVSFSIPECMEIGGVIKPFMVRYKQQYINLNQVALIDTSSSKMLVQGLWIDMHKDSLDYIITLLK